jgi:16S rRNA (cytosine1402-N4)-methyltransferase
VTLHKNKKQEKMHQNPYTNSHNPVLLTEVLEYVSPKKGERYLDTTAGYGGHAQAILQLTENYKQSVLVDRDAHALNELEKKFSNRGIAIIHQDYLNASTKLEGKSQFDIIVADLGVSSPHLNESKRGFSFSEVGPLDMRMDQRQEKTAWEIVNKASEQEIADLLWKYGEEPKSRQIARLIVKYRPIQTTSQLATIVKQAWPGHSRTHPATRTFQALRIVVNNELDQLSRALPIWLKLLAPGGRLAIISFHSLEDRIVKQFYASESGDRYDASLNLLTKHPVTPGPLELAINPRSRSAKLRVAAKQK